MGSIHFRTIVQYISKRRWASSGLSTCTYPNFKITIPTGYVEARWCSGCIRSSGKAVVKLGQPGLTTRPVSLRGPEFKSRSGPYFYASSVD